MLRSRKAPTEDHGTRQIERPGTEALSTRFPTKPRMLRLIILAGSLVAMAGCSKPPAPETDRPEPAETASQTATAPPTADSPAVTSPDQLPTDPAADPATDPAADPATDPAADPAAEQPATEAAEAAPAEAVLDPLQADQVSHWLVQLSQGADVERRAAIEALSDLDRVTFQYVVQRLDNGTRHEQLGAAKLLIGRVGPRDNDAVETLIKLLSTEDDALRHTAFQALERLPAQQLQPALPSLLNILKNPQEDDAYRVRAVRAIQKLGAAVESAAATLMPLGRQDPNLDVRRAVFAAVPHIVTAQEAEAYFLKTLDDEIPTDLRRLAVERLGQTARSQQALDGLLSQFHHPDLVVCKAASLALVDIGRPAVPTLIQGLASENPQVRRYAAFSLGKLGPLAAEAVPALEERLEDPSEDVRQLAAAALRLIKR